MLLQGSVGQIRNGELTKKKGYLVVAMCFYPRGLRKELLDEYRSDLAPDRALFKDWQKYEKSYGHDRAFDKSSYEERFQLSADALAHLKILSELGRKCDVYFICQCQPKEKCHREILLLAARAKFNADVGAIAHKYPVIEKRLMKGSL